ncbi:hypothetical protein BN2476_420054 [Paraburkholderia piptadeniae]|uniref:Uncharacterized protein n=1 Tax=Paraburkholderia piptadeniae TaxID=1701573 RepID=A0A1N7SB07_9BURK|nr:hypothetical protein BN2476_420054 [Paraburkholderia piptadeniae]
MRAGCTRTGPLAVVPLAVDGGGLKPGNVARGCEALREPGTGTAGRPAWLACAPWTAVFAAAPAACAGTITASSQ